MIAGKSPELIIALAKEFISSVNRIAPTWSKAYWRFESEQSRFGSNSSYVTKDGVFLISAMKEKAMYEAMNSLGRQLWLEENDAKKQFCVCLLIVDKSFNYEIKFERDNISKWKITKLDGKSGVPEEL